MLGCCPGAPAGPRHHLREPSISHAQKAHQHFQARCLSPLILDLLWSHRALIRKAHFVNNKHFCTFCEYDVVTLNFWTKFWIGLFSLPSGWPERELIRLITKFPHLQQWHFYAVLFVAQSYPAHLIQNLFIPTSPQSPGFVSPGLHWTWVLFGDSGIGFSCEKEM